MKHRTSYSDQMQNRRIFAKRLRVLVIIFLAYGVIAGFFLKAYSVESLSMTPTLEKGDIVLSTPVLYGARNELFGFHAPGISKPRRGDIVVVDAPFRTRSAWFVRAADTVVRFLSFQRIGIIDAFSGIAWRSVKRVIGVPGDLLYQKHFVYYVKPGGEPHFLTEFELSGDAYDIVKDGIPEGWPSEFPLSGEHGELLLGPDEYFVAGDNRSGAMDSRMYGPIPSSSILSLVILRYWPVGRFGPAK
ncbi:MAG: signal peptidase I [Spirochaetes bacterium]|nr:signal peptidase I [Spirochaetota bacterium]